MAKEEFVEDMRKRAYLRILYAGIPFVTRTPLQFMNVENGKMLDEKIQVLEDFLDGKAPADIPNFYKVLDDYPKEENGMCVEW